MGWAMKGFQLMAYDRARGGDACICGADEAGRACVAGPLVAAAVRLDYAHIGAAARQRLEGLNDSKKLSATQRAALLPILVELADMVSVVVISAAQIDRAGLHESNLDALRRALQAVAVAGSVNLVDAYELTGNAPRHESLARGDQTSAAIAAASIVAKETRDGLMRQIDVEHPGYDFAVHKGYNTPGHVRAVERQGRLSPVHRRSFRWKAIATLDLAA